MNGDGRPDLRVFTTAYERWSALMTEGFPDLIVKYEDAYQASTEVTYLPMTSKEVYVRSSYRAAPYTNAISSQALVQSYMSGSIAPKAKVEFKYWDAAVSLTGRGWQGFASVQEYRRTSEITTLRRYHQQTSVWDFWKTGLLFEEKVQGLRNVASGGANRREQARIERHSERVGQNRFGCWIRLSVFGCSHYHAVRCG